MQQTFLVLSVCPLYSNIPVPLDRFSKGKNLKPENKLQKQADFPREVNKSKKKWTLTKCSYLINSSAYLSSPS